MDEMWKIMVEQRLKTLEAGFARVARGAPSAAQAPRAAPAAARTDSSNDADLDGPYGDPLVRRDPPRWKGDSRVGYKFSDCEPEYLDSLAGFFEWQAKKDEESGHVSGTGRPTAPYKKKDAARARGWAARIRGFSGSTSTIRKAPPEPEPEIDLSADEDDEMPF